ncbi:spermatogenesis-associated protein 20-like isoform X1 [Ipomoea triloba]|uniref:spermatogenesis-associated protein 20-like isoform X1 n=2 Tax=Ipomoea triloba TaxID=35885 RepID=UPI00125D5D9D|nr:spermatogenesis-associated protein 20-like isoform X1 [Ipomoea triloba]XP_031107700.1 spermatogenesis-associated protein 20-like isoform X1 [Ipomoea triloba]
MLYHSKMLVGEGKSDEARKVTKMVMHTLECMAKGGIRDHVGGGFHRYSGDECWHVPHFEKMLYDQGQLVNAYLNAFCITKDVFYSSVCRDILDYLRRDMIGPTGEIFSVEDADSLESEDASRKKEGAFYVWSSSEFLLKLVYLETILELPSFRSNQSLIEVHLEISFKLFSRHKDEVELKIELPLQARYQVA